MRLAHNISIRRWFSWSGLLSLVLAIGTLFPPGALARGFYAAICGVVSWYTVYGYPGYLTMTGKHVVVRYRFGDQVGAGLVLAAAEQYYERVMASFQVRPTGRVPVVVYPTAVSLNRSFGWAGDLKAMGAYWAGVIRVVTPSEWIEAGSAQADIFFSEGPMAHELTHYAVDRRTGGNCPRWLQEGLAQWEEMRLTGFRPAAPDVETWYSLAELTDHFDSLTDQSAAYHQSLTAVTYMYKQFGSVQVDLLLRRLGNGEPVAQAIDGVFGENPVERAGILKICVG